MLQIAICDDEVTNILKVKELAELFFRTHCVEIRIEIYKSSDNLLYDMQDGQYFDLFLLDIEMPEVSGMDLAKTIYRIYPQQESFLLRLIWNMRLRHMNFQCFDIFLKNYWTINC